MITAFKQPRINIFQRFSLFILPGLLTISTTLISCSVQTPNSENKTAGFKAKVVRIGYQSSGDIFRLKGLTEKRLKPLGVSVEWAQLATENPKLVRLVLEEIDNTGEWGDKNRSEVVKLTIPHLKIDEDILTTMVERRTYGLRPITPEIMENQQQIADLLAKKKVITEHINIKEAMLTSEQYAAITPENISQK
ncbi:hypothetical protein [Nostoc sp.]|uniref:hypothetical protein n=1 Tax=Nostoc sp. TaxID=1180 RepID=UPI002FF7F1CC